MTTVLIVIAGMLLIAAIAGVATLFALTYQAIKFTDAAED